jgi:hypothetical protein
MKSVQIALTHDGEAEEPLSELEVEAIEMFINFLRLIGLPKYLSCCARLARCGWFMSGATGGIIT